MGIKTTYLRIITEAETFDAYDHAVQISEPEIQKITINDIISDFREELTELGWTSPEKLKMLKDLKAIKNGEICVVNGNHYVIMDIEKVANDYVVGDKVYAEFNIESIFTEKQLVKYKKIQEKELEKVKKKKELDIKRIQDRKKLEIEKAKKLLLTEGVRID